MPDYAELDDAVGHLSRYGWVVFSSVNGVCFIRQRLAVLGLDARALGGVGVGRIDDIDPPRDVPGAAGLTDYVSGDAPAADGTGLGYDGPRPPFFDARWHVYRWVVLALDVELAHPAVFR